MLSGSQTAIIIVKQWRFTSVKAEPMEGKGPQTHKTICIKWKNGLQENPKDILDKIDTRKS